MNGRGKPGGAGRTRRPERPAAPARARPTPAPRGGKPGHLVSGPRAVMELFDAAPERVHELWITEGRSGEVRERADALGIRVVIAGRDEIDRLAGGDARGVLAVADPPPLHALDELAAAVGERGVLVALDGVQDPQNWGAICRTCEFFGAAGLLWPRDRAVGLGPAAARASAGASERMTLCEVGNLARALSDLKDAGLWIVGTVAEGGEPLGRLVAQGRLPDRLVVVLGAEHEGLRRLTRERCDFLATLLRRGRVGSLNVAAAAAVVLWAVCGEPAFAD